MANKEVENVAVVKTSSYLFPATFSHSHSAEKILGKFHVAAATKWNCLLFGVFIEKQTQLRPLLQARLRLYDDDDAGVGDGAAADAELKLWVKDVASDNDNDNNKSK